LIYAGQDLNLVNKDMSTETPKTQPKSSENQGHSENLSRGPHRQRIGKYGYPGEEPKQFFEDRY